MLAKRTVFLTLALLSGLAWAFPLGAHASAPRKETLIYFVRQKTYREGPQIWAVRPNGTHLREIAKGYDAVISPNGKKVYCACAHGVGVMDPDGSHLRILGPRLHIGALSGTGLIAQSGSNGAASVAPSALNTELFLTKVGGGTPRPIYHVKEEREHNGIQTGRFHLGNAPAISSDGRLVGIEEGALSATSYSYMEITPEVCKSISPPAPPACQESFYASIAINTETSSPSTIEEYFASSDEGFCGPKEQMAPVAFSADDSTLLLENDSCPLVRYFLAGPNGGVRGTFTVPQGAKSENAGATAAALSPNGQKVAYEEKNYFGVASGGLFVISADGSDPHRIVPSFYEEGPTSWGEVILPRQKGKTSHLPHGSHKRY